jgi:2-polyprenyl-6-methoxyphenol hydroxylase-like FAD-dependent oxidoreductase
MEGLRVLVIGGGIGGLTAAIALREGGHAVDLIERNSDWSVYGVGIIQQSNVVRAMADLDLLDDYLAVACGFDSVEIFNPAGEKVATVPSPRLAEGYPANVGIARPALHEVLVTRAAALDTNIRLGVTATMLNDDGAEVSVAFSDGTPGRYDMVVGADGISSTTREMVFPDAPRPQFTGQGVWRHNFERPNDLAALQTYEGPIGIGLVPIGPALMYMFVTTPEPGNPQYPHDRLAEVMRSKLRDAPPAIAALRDRIVDDAEVVYRPLEWLFVEGAWHHGRVVLLGDAVHATTPHLGQGAGMAIEDSIVLADELARAETIEAAFGAYRSRRYERCDYITKASLAICKGQIGEGPQVMVAKAAMDVFNVTAQPI